MIKSKLFQTSIFSKYERVKRNYIWDYREKLRYKKYKILHTDIAIVSEIYPIYGFIVSCSS